ncbi:MAG: hypothetical protein NDF55_03355 [archaeon GB-1867-005]|nr:hypothetical protein [Candidatus Culexmicrobium cathedralense]
MGRLTISIRMKLEAKIMELENKFKNALISLKRRRAFDKIVEAWSRELQAISYLNSPTLMESMLLVAAVDNRSEIEELKEKVKWIAGKVEKLKEGLKGEKRS